jgi:dTDP-4-amino-4,6-dideoxygalactose transaminase
MEPYRSYFPHAGLLLPVTERLVQQVICLPTGTGVDAASVERICGLIRYAVDHGAEIEAQLEQVRP